MKLAIQGNQLLGDKIITFLEMLGGVNTGNLYGDINNAYYFIGDNNEIEASYLSEDVNSEQYLLKQYLLYSLEEFEKKFPFKIGDKVFFKRDDPEDVHRIIKMEWDERYDEVRYVIKSVKNGEVDKIHWLAEYLEPYHEISKYPPSKEEIRYTHIWEVNGTLVVADSIDEAMEIYRGKEEKFNEIESVKKFTTVSRGAAYIKITRHE